MREPGEETETAVPKVWRRNSDVREGARTGLHADDSALNPKSVCAGSRDDPRGQRHCLPKQDTSRRPQETQGKDDGESGEGHDPEGGETPQRSRKPGRLLHEETQRGLHTGSCGGGVAAVRATLCRRWKASLAGPRSPAHPADERDQALRMREPGLTAKRKSAREIAGGKPHDQNAALAALGERSASLRKQDRRSAGRTGVTQRMGRIPTPGGL